MEAPSQVEQASAHDLVKLLLLSLSGITELASLLAVLCHACFLLLSFEVYTRADDGEAKGTQGKPVDCFDSALEI